MHLLARELGCQQFLSRGVHFAAPFPRVGDKLDVVRRVNRQQGFQAMIGCMAQRIACRGNRLAQQEITLGGLGVRNRHPAPEEVFGIVTHGFVRMKHAHVPMILSRCGARNVHFGGTLAADSAVLCRNTRENCNR